MRPFDSIIQPNKSAPIKVFGLDNRSITASMENTNNNHLRIMPSPFYSIINATYLLLSPVKRIDQILHQ